jgi:hypothetical protein
LYLVRAVTKIPAINNLREEGFIFSHGCKRVLSMMAGRAWQRRTAFIMADRSRENRITGRARARYYPKDTPTSSDLLPPSRPHLLLSAPSNNLIIL